MDGAALMQQRDDFMPASNGSDNACNTGTIYLKGGDYSGFINELKTQIIIPEGL